MPSVQTSAWVTFSCREESSPRRTTGLRAGDQNQQAAVQAVPQNLGFRFELSRHYGNLAVAIHQLPVYCRAQNKRAPRHTFSARRSSISEILVAKAPGERQDLRSDTRGSKALGHQDLANASAPSRKSCQAPLVLSPAVSGLPDGKGEVAVVSAQLESKAEFSGTAGTAACRCPCSERAIRLGELSSLHEKVTQVVCTTATPP